MNLLQMLHESVLSAPDKACLLSKKDGQYSAITYQEFWQRTQQFAQGLHKLGVNFGDRVAIMAENCPEWAISDYGILSLGAVVVPIYSTLPSSQACYILKNAEVKWLVVGNRTHYDVVMADQPDGLDGVILMTDEVNESQVPVYRMEDVIHIGAVSKVDVSEASIPTFDMIRENTVATIVHTSGTSGDPKGVMLTHGNLVSNIRACLSVTPVYPDDICLSYLPLSHIFERTVTQFVSLSSQGTIAYAESIETIRVNLLEVRPTVLVTVPRLLEKVYAGIHQKLRQAPKLLRGILQAGVTSSATGISLSRWLADKLVFRKVRDGLGGRLRLIVSGGAGLSGDIAEFYMKAGLLVCEGYGMSETAPVICVNPPSDSRPGTVGRPIPGVDVRIAEDGELLVRGPNVMMGYYNAPGETMKAFTPDGWLKTGDIAEIDGGYVKIVDRKKNILVLATGKNVAPWPLENAITLSPYIADAVLIGDGKKYVSCLVVPDRAAFEEKFGDLKEFPLHDEAWIRHPGVQEQVKHDIVAATEKFADFERPKRAYLLPVPFSLESGELTPTLKVKTRMIAAKYKREIDAMYAGEHALILMDAQDEGAALNAFTATSGGALAASTRTEQVNQVKRGARSRKWPWLLIPLFILVGVAVFASSMHLRIPKAYDLLGTIGHIGKTNNDINAENQKIVGQMGRVRDLSSITPHIAADLNQLNHGLAAQNGKLSTLSNLSQQEVDLSTQFRSVATGLRRDLSRISTTSKQQSTAVSNMSKLAQHMNGIATQLATTNDRAAAKLNQISRDTAEVANEVP